jgi:hypothetical protein
LVKKRRHHKDPTHMAVVGIVSIVAVIGLMLVFVSVAPLTNVGQALRIKDTSSAYGEDTEEYGYTDQYLSKIEEKLKLTTPVPVTRGPPLPTNNLIKYEGKDKEGRTNIEIRPGINLLFTHIIETFQIGEVPEVSVRAFIRTVDKDSEWEEIPCTSSGLSRIGEVECMVDTEPLEQRGLLKVEFQKGGTVNQIEEYNFYQNPKMQLQVATDKKSCSCERLDLWNSGNVQRTTKREIPRVRDREPWVRSVKTQVGNHFQVSALIQQDSNPALCPEGQEAASTVNYNYKDGSKETYHLEKSGEGPPAKFAPDGEYGFISGKMTSDDYTKEVTSVLRDYLKKMYGEDAIFWDDTPGFIFSAGREPVKIKRWDLFHVWVENSNGIQNPSCEKYFTVVHSVDISDEISYTSTLSIIEDPKGLLSTDIVS